MHQIGILQYTCRESISGDMESKLWCMLIEANRENMTVAASMKSTVVV
jgi:hypothetical protein